MKLGLYGINASACVNPTVAAAVAQDAERAGFESLWTAEHVVLPDPQRPPSPLPPLSPLLDPAVSLAFVAGATTRIRLATGIVILPQRNPVVLAKEFASLDQLSQGRLIFGVAAGYLEAEFAAVGARFRERGALTDEYLDAIVELWTSEAPAFKGRTLQFSGIQQRPQPMQKPHPPIVLGGMSDAALERAVRRANGWYGFALDPSATAELLARLARAAERVDRPSSFGALEITITPPAPLTRDAVLRYAELGVARLVPLGFGRDQAAISRAIDASAEAITRAGFALPSGAEARRAS